jgi:branched-chain amino acid transport system ATP-binding protein
MENWLLKIEHVTKDFGGLRALENIDLNLERGKTTGLIGPNGAGKTTLFNIVAGIYPSTEGRVFLEEKCINGIPTYKRVELGISRTFQLTRLFKEMTVLENVMVGGNSWTSRNRIGASIAAMFNMPSVQRHAKEIHSVSMEMLKTMGIEELANEIAGNLPYGQQRLVEIARALSTKPRLLLLDEPAAGLNPSEVESFKRTLRSIIAKHMITVLIVEHDMKLVMSVCDAVCVLNVGKKIAEGAPSEIARNENVIKAYLGKEFQFD